MDTDQHSQGTGATVNLTGVSKTYELGAGEHITAVDKVDLCVPAGCALALTGPSGSGKSTLLHLIGAIERPDQGTIEVDGQSLAKLSRRSLADHRRHIGFVFQRYNLLPALTALDNVVAPVLPYRTSYDKVERARQLLDYVGLAGRERSLPSRLSGGQQQRVAIARALIGSPHLLLADEPTGNLDTVTGREIVELLIQLRNQQGMTIIIATHDPRIAARTNRIIQLRDGRITDELDLPPAQPPDEVLKRIAGLDAS